MVVFMPGTLHAAVFRQIPREEMRRLLQKAIAVEEEQFEHTIVKTYAALQGTYLQLFQAFVSQAQRTKTCLAQLYAQCATVSEGVEFLVYAHRAVALNPQVTIQQWFSFTPRVKGFIVDNTGNAKQGYIGRRHVEFVIQTEYMGPLEKLLRGVKEEAIQHPDALTTYEAAYATKMLADIGRKK